MMVECSALNRTSVANPTRKALGIPGKGGKIEFSVLNRTSIANPTLKALGIPWKWAKRI